MNADLTRLGEILRALTYAYHSADHRVLFLEAMMILTRLHGNVGVLREIVPALAKAYAQDELTKLEADALMILQLGSIPGTVREGSRESGRTD